MRNESQTTAILCILCGTQLSAIVWPGYRCLSSRVFDNVLGWTSICNIGSGWLLSLDVRSFFLVDSKLQYALLAFNGLGMLLALSVVFVEIIIDNTSHQVGNAVRSGSSAPKLTRSGWPVTVRDASEVTKHEALWLDQIVEAGVLLEKNHRRLPLFVDPVPLENLIGRLKKSACHAADRGGQLWCAFCTRGGGGTWAGVYPLPDQS